MPAPSLREQDSHVIAGTSASQVLKVTFSFVCLPNFHHHHLRNINTYSPALVILVPPSVDEIRARSRVCYRGHRIRRTSTNSASVRPTWLTGSVRSSIWLQNFATASTTRSSLALLKLLSMLEIPDRRRGAVQLCCRRALKSGARLPAFTSRATLLS